MRAPGSSSWAAAAGLVLVTVLLAAPADPEGGKGRPWNVRTYGALRAIFHEGALDATVRLDELLPDPRLYGVGALSGLRGEVTIVRGVPFVSYPVGSESRTESPPEHPESACLLVTAQVSGWREATLERDVGFDALDDTIEALAAANGLDTEEAFPFLTESAVRDLEWHVIDGGRLPEGGATHRDHVSAAVKHRAAEARATLVGFYSPRDHGVFTHMGSNTHVHAVVADARSAGHVDGVTLPAGTVIRFPAGGPRSD